MRADECTCTYYAVDMSDPERYHPENVDREGDPECPVHRDADNVPSDRLATYAEATQAIDLIVRRLNPEPAEAVVHLDAQTLVPVGISRPCPSTTTAHLGFQGLSGVRVPCGHLVGHDGPHAFHVEWTEPTKEGETNG